MQGQTLDLTSVGNEAVASFLAIQGLVTVRTVATTPAGVCKNQPFHWNGTELVICSTGPAPWPDLEAVPVHISLVAGSLRFQFEGDGSTDQVDGVAPEYREQLVRYLGPERGHAQADRAMGPGGTYRLFITPNWQSEAAIPEPEPAGS